MIRNSSAAKEVARKESISIRGYIRPRSFINQMLFYYSVEPELSNLDPHVYSGFTYKSHYDAIQFCYSILSKPNSSRYVGTFDLSSVYEHLQRSVEFFEPEDRRSLRNILKGSDEYHPLFREMLMNILLKGLHEDVREFSFQNRLGCGRRQPGVNVIRFENELVITSGSMEKVELIKDFIVNWIRKRVGISIPYRMHSVYDGFDFIGFTVRRFEEKLIVTPSKTSIKNLLDKVRLIFKSNLSSKQSTVIYLVNSELRKFVAYFKTQCSTESFSSIQDKIWVMTWKWSIRRHKRKSRYMVANKYYRTVQGRKWVFTDGDVILVNITKLGIKRYIKVKSNTPYFSRENMDYYSRHLKSVPNVLLSPYNLAISNKTDHRCFFCGNEISYYEWIRWACNGEPRVHFHHIIFRSNGGSDSVSNMAVAHSLCHLKFHSECC